MGKHELLLLLLLLWLQRWLQPLGFWLNPSDLNVQITGLFHTVLCQRIEAFILFYMRL